jgi:hypothetical protein
VMVIPDETAQRVREYLAAQSAKLGLPDLVEKVRHDADALHEAALGVPPGRLCDRPGGPESSDWSAAEMLTHVLQANAICADAIEAMIERGAGDVYLDATNEERPRVASGLLSADEYWHALCERRERLFARVLAARGDEHPTATLHHQWFGRLTWRETLLFLRLHDGDHARGLQAIAVSLQS